MERGKDLTTNGELDNSFTQGFGSSADINLSIGRPIAPHENQCRSHADQYPKPRLMFPHILLYSPIQYGGSVCPAGKDTFLLDATDPFHAINQLDPDCYNRIGWVVQAEGTFLDQGAGAGRIGHLVWRFSPLTKRNRCVANSPFPSVAKPPCSGGMNSKKQKTRTIL